MAERPAAESEDRRELDALSDAIARPGVAISQLDPIVVSTTGAAESSATEPDSPAGVVAVHQEEDAFLVTIRLPKLDNKQAYEAWWWSKDGRPALAAEFNVDEKGYARTKLRGDPRRMQSLTVNIGPAGSANTPSSDVVFTGVLPASNPNGG